MCFETLSRSFRLAKPTSVCLCIAFLCGCGGSGSSIISQQISVVLSQNSASVQVGAPQPFTATVSPVSASQNVTWSLSGQGCKGSACGTLSDISQNPVTYMAPMAVPNPATVTVTATAVSDPTQQASATITITSPVITMAVVAATDNIPLGAVRPFIAHADGDPFDQGVTWALSGTGCNGTACGTISATKTGALGSGSPENLSAYTFYTAPLSMPSPSTVTLTATSVTNPAYSAISTITVTPTNNGLLNGTYAFLFHGFDSNGELAMAGRFHADGAGNITDGIQDVNSVTLVSGNSPMSFSGTYIIGPDNKGQMTLTDARGVATFSFVSNSAGTMASFVQFDDVSDTGTRGDGSFQKQDASAFSLAQTNGDFAMNLTGDLPGTGHTVLLGRFTSSTTGVVSKAVLDCATSSASSASVLWTSSMGAPNSTTGRGTLTLNANIPAPALGAINLHFAYYIIAKNQLFLIGTDARGSALPLLSGPANAQNLAGGFSNASLDGNIIVGLEGISNVPEPQVGLPNSFSAADQITASQGNLTGFRDELDASTVISNAPFTGTYQVSANGRATMTLQLDPATVRQQVLYLTDSNTGFILDIHDNEVNVGQFKPQSPGPFNAATVAGTFDLDCGPPLLSDFQTCVGLSTLDGVGNITSTIDSSDTIQNLRVKIRSGTYVVDANGRGTQSWTDGTVLTFWIVSPTEFFTNFGWGLVKP
jgi:hypothetical protein